MQCVTRLANINIETLYHKVHTTSPTRSISDKLDKQLKIASEIIIQNKDQSINSDALKHIIENVTNKNINIRVHDFCNLFESNATNLLKLVELIRPILTDRSIKTKMIKLSNLLFQSLSSSEN